MPRSIWKFPLPMRGGVEMPKGARILSVHMQNGQPQVWALVDPQAPLVKRRLRVYGTGWDVLDDPVGVFLGTYLIEGGQYVFHVFDAGESPPA